MKTLIFILLILSPNIAVAENRIVQTARAEIGNGEVGCDNCGKFVKAYNKGTQAAWCAGFVSYVVKKSGYTLPYILSAKGLYNELKKQNKLVSDPKPGDLIFFWRESPSSWKGHVGIVEKVSNGQIQTIEGNVGDYPAKVKRFNYNMDSIPRLLGFGRIS